ncbi:MAG: ornithine cyclodeaminase family protein [Candidatus Velthaea sp.]
MRVIGEAEAAAVLARLDLPEIVRDVVRRQAEGTAVVPVRASLEYEGVWFAAMPALVAGSALGAKLVAAFSANAARGAPTHDAAVVLFDAGTGAPFAVVAGEALTRARTAAISVVATQALAARPRGRHAILGAGAQAHAHLAAFARAGLLDDLCVWSRTHAHAVALAEAARALGCAARIAPSAGDAVTGCDVVTTVTAAAQPLFDAAAVAPQVHVNAVGACVAHKRELPGALVRRAFVVTDSTAAARVESGDLLLEAPLGDALWDSVAELGAVLVREFRRTPTVFISLGIGSVDVAVAAEVAAAVAPATRSSC